MSLPSNLVLSPVLRDEISKRSKVKSLELNSYESVLIKRQLSSTNRFSLNLLDLNTFNKRQPQKIKAKCMLWVESYQKSFFKARYSEVL